MSGDLIERNEAILNHCILECHKAPDITCNQYCPSYRLFNNIPAVEKRKKGKWVRTIKRYATPGGDPVWECSECGKGTHTYGIEYSSYSSDISDGQWVSCPNCGADMRGEQDE